MGFPVTVFGAHSAKGAAFKKCASFGCVNLESGKFRRFFEHYKLQFKFSDPANCRHRSRSKETPVLRKTKKKQ